jgi:hypothetical protein
MGWVSGPVMRPAHQCCGKLVEGLKCIRETQSLHFISFISCFSGAALVLVA